MAEKKSKEKHKRRRKETGSVSSILLSLEAVLLLILLNRISILPPFESNVEVIPCFCCQCQLSLLLSIHAPGHVLVV